jgi:hypothetical protein
MTAAGIRKELRNASKEADTTAQIQISGLVDGKLKAGDIYLVI